MWYIFTKNKVLSLFVRRPSAIENSRHQVKSKEHGDRVIKAQQHLGAKIKRTWSPKQRESNQFIHNLCAIDYLRKSKCTKAEISDQTVTYIVFLLVETSFLTSHDVLRPSFKAPVWPVSTLLLFYIVFLTIMIYIKPDPTVKQHSHWFVEWIWNYTRKEK